MLVTRDPVVAETVRALRNQGRRPSDGWLDHALLGYNYRISEINCALGISQMGRLDTILARRADRAACYREHLRNVPEATLPVFETPHGRVCWFVFAVRLPHRDRVMQALTAREIGCARYFAPLHQQPLYAEFVQPGQDLSATVEAASQTLALPFFNALSDAAIAEVCETLRAALPIS